MQGRTLRQILAILLMPLHCWLFVCRCFSDGFPDLFVHHATEIRNRHVGFLASFHDPGKIFEQISIIYALPRLFIGSFTLVLPFFPTGTAERVRGLDYLVLDAPCGSSCCCVLGSRLARSSCSRLEQWEVLQCGST